MMLIGSLRFFARSMISARRSCRNGGGVSVEHWRASPTPAAARCRPARSSRFWLCTPTVQASNISRKLLSRLRRSLSCCAATFPACPCHEHFVALQKSAFVPLVFFLVSHLGTRTGLYYIDFTALPVCDNDRINRHKVFAGLLNVARPRWVELFGFKLHLVFNNDNEIVAKLTPGNVHDTTPVPALTR